MKKVLSLFIVLAAAVCAQTIETIPFRALMLPSNEVPAIDIVASGTATILAHVVRDASGNVVSGSVDFRVRYGFPGDTTFTGLHIHPGAAGVNGPVVIASGIGSGTASVNDPAGKGVILRQGQVSGGAALDALKGLLDNPSGYYVNMHTTVNPGGVIRGQLMPAETVVGMAMMDPRNEVPAVTNVAASGVGLFRAWLTRGAGGVINSAEIAFDVNYAFPAQVTFTGLHIHAASAGTNGAIVLPSVLTREDSTASGQGAVSFMSELGVSSAAVQDALNGLQTHPWDYYMNIHTSVNAGGVMRGQVRFTDMARFQVTMLASNETPPLIDLAAQAPAAITTYTLRGSDGAIQAGTAVFDVNPRFPGSTEFTGLHIHDGKAGVAGPVTIPTTVSSANSVIADTGAANVYAAVLLSGGTGLATLNSLLLNPENHYVNLHTKDNPGGAVRSQLMAANSALPVVSAVISSVSDATLKAQAPGGMITVFGQNLNKVASDLSGWQGDFVPTALNGTSVTIGNQKAPVLWVTPGYIVAQVPFELKTGSQDLVVSNSNGASAAFSVQLNAQAPGLFFDQNGGIIAKNAGFTLVGRDNPASVGEYVVIYGSGFGQTSPALQTGQLAPGQALAYVPSTVVSIGGQTVPAVYSIASPGFAGLYQVAVRVPQVSGNVPVVVSVNGAASNTVTMFVK